MAKGCCSRVSNGSLDSSNESCSSGSVTAGLQAAAEAAASPQEVGGGLAAVLSRLEGREERQLPTSSMNMIDMILFSLCKIHIS